MKMKQKLTNIVVSNFTCPEGKQKGFLSDTEVSGLKLRVTPRNMVGAFCINKTFENAMLRLGQINRTQMP